MSRLRTGTNSNNENARTKTASTKLTRAELVGLENFAQGRGKSPGEFIRDLIFREMETGAGAQVMDSTLQEIVGVQLLLMNILKPIATGQPLTAAAFDNIVAEVHKLKKTVARKLIHEEK
jgi:hypothetical protein